jgi:hypothetical protein
MQEVFEMKLPPRKEADRLECKSGRVAYSCTCQECPLTVDCPQEFEPDLEDNEDEN